MVEELISFETAKLAKEKGFSEFTQEVFNQFGKLFIFNSGLLTNHERIQAPTQSLLQKWLRETHFLNVEVTHHGYNKEDNHFSFRAKVKTITKIKQSDNNGCLSDVQGDFYIFRSYEQALEKGLQEALKLIK